LVTIHYFRAKKPNSGGIGQANSSKHQIREYSTDMGNYQVEKGN
jgi:hypothetical protein